MSVRKIVHLRCLIWPEPQDRDGRAQAALKLLGESLLKFFAVLYAYFEGIDRSFGATSNLITPASHP